MLEAYFSFGGNEVGNSVRAYRLALAAECPPGWNFRDPKCDAIAEAQESGNYTDPTLAPWYDPDDPEATSRFLGLYVVDFLNVSSSTRTARVTQLNTDGGKVSGYRHNSREIRVRAWLSAIGDDAMEAGMTWLRNVLEPDACGVHGGTCGTADLAFFVTCPPARTEEETEAEYQERVRPTRRFFHSVRAVSGPLEIETRRRQDFRGKLVEFTFVAEVPYVYGAPKALEIPPLTPTVMQDVPYNLLTHPSAEVTSTPVVVATNYTTNPSVETNNTNWGVTADGTNILSAQLVGSRSNELAASGTWSEKVLWTAAGAGASAGWFGAQQGVTLPVGVGGGPRCASNGGAGCGARAGGCGAGARAVQERGVFELSLGGRGDE